MKFFRFIFGRGGRARWVLVGSILTGAVAGAGSVGLLGLVNRSLRSADASSGGDLGLAFAGLILLVTLARAGSVTLLSNLGQSMVRDLRLQLSRQALSASLARIEALGAPRILATLTDDINALTQALVMVPTVFVNGTIVVGCLGYLAWLDPELFLLLLVAVVLGVVSYRVPVVIGMRRFREAREEQDTLFDHFRGLTEGIKELKLHRRRRGAFVRLLEDTAERVRRLRIFAAVVYGGAAAWGHLLFFVVIGVLLFVRPGFVEVDRDLLVGYTVVLLYMMSPLQTLLNMAPNLGRAEVAVEKIRHLGFQLDAEDAVPLGAGGGEPAGRPAAAETVEERPSWNRLELDGVTLTYHREGRDVDFTLGPASLEIRPGEVVFLVGGNGSGKTTLAKLLVGLYAPEQGEIRVDGRPVTEADRDDYRQLFSVVFGDFYLFERLLGLDAPDLDERARRYLEELQIDHKVEVEDGALSTVNLSQGQRKRLALLTAYLEDRPIYLFDEWAADQDPMFKQVFYGEVLPELARRGKGVVAISHDDRYYRMGDRVVKLEDGRVVHDGPPGDLPVGAGEAPVVTAN